MELNKDLFSRLLSQKLGKVTKIINIEKAGSGYHSDGFKAVTLDGKEFFIKKFKSNDLGFALPERKIYSLLISDGMGKRANLNPKPLGVILINKNDGAFIPEVNEETEIFHIQEFEKCGADYFKILHERKDKKEIDQKDRAELKKIVDYISSVHSVKYPSNDIERKKEVYNDGIRAVLNSPELTLMILHEFDENYPIIDREKQKEFLGLMYDVMHKWKNRADRLCALHGDFWGANLIFKDDGNICVIDYSRIPWGDSGIDIGWWISQYLWLYNMTGNIYFKNLGELFINEYERKTNDKEIRQAVSISLGLLGLINVFPRFYPNGDIDKGRKFIELCTKIMKEQKLIWE